MKRKIVYIKCRLLVILRFPGNEICDKTGIINMYSMKMDVTVTLVIIRETTVSTTNLTTDEIIRCDICRHLCDLHIFTSYIK